MKQVVIWPKFLWHGKALDMLLRGETGPFPIEPCYLMNGRELGECLAQTEPFEVVEAIDIPFEEWDHTSS